MKNINEAIVFGLNKSAALLERYVADLSPSEYLHRPAPKANCVAWLLGHLTQSDRGAINRLGAEDLPVLPDEFDQRFGRDETSAGASDFGDVAALLPLFKAHRQRLIEAVESTDPQRLSAALDKPHPMFGTLAELASFMSIHTAMHAGQITTIRRSLGKPPLV